MKNNVKFKALVAAVFAAMFALFMVACSSGSGSAASASASASSASASASASSAAAPANPVVRISTTTSVNDSGLLPYLQPYFEEATGYKWAVTSAGT